jgi:NAD-dependent dihydropyrimidine dehydrogenase PreA subunit
MKRQTYLKNVVTLQLDTDKCTGCGMCVLVCPHRVLQLRENTAVIADKDACMECGACSRNCPVQAISVRPGVGCAVAVFKGILGKGEPNCDCCCQSQSNCP